MRAKATSLKKPEPDDRCRGCSCGADGGGDGVLTSLEKFKLDVDICLSLIRDQFLCFENKVNTILDKRENIFKTKRRFFYFRLIYK